MHVAKNKTLFYLKSNCLGSVLNFNKVIRINKKSVILDNGSKVQIINGVYVTPVVNWDNIYYDRFNTIKECVAFINTNYDKLKDMDIFAIKTKSKNEFIKRISDGLEAKGHYFFGIPNTFKPFYKGKIENNSFILSVFE